MSYETYTVIDCETLAPHDVDQWIEPGSAPSNYKDPEKIAAYIADDKRKRADKAATDVDLAEILCVGAYASHLPSEAVDILRAWDEDGVSGNEREVVCQALHYLASPAIIGFRIQFDLPLILRRAQLLGVPAEDLPRFEFSKYRPSELVWPVSGYRTAVVDLGAVLTFYGAVPGKSLDWYARRFGCPIEDGHDGSQIAALWEAGDVDAITAHCTADIRRTAWLAARVGLVATVGDSVAA